MHLVTKLYIFLILLTAFWWSATVKVISSFSVFAIALSHRRHSAHHNRLECSEKKR